MLALHRWGGWGGRVGSDPDLSILISDAKRSLALCLPEWFSFSFAMNRSGSDISVRTVFAIGGRGSW